jgi:hypothetical protein
MSPPPKTYDDGVSDCMNAIGLVLIFDDEFEGSSMVDKYAAMKAIEVKLNKLRKENGYEPSSY